MQKVADPDAVVRLMARYGKQWKWPSHEDELFCKNNDIVMVFKKPARCGNRDFFDITKCQLSLKTTFNFNP